jgi:hypothetical protein
MLLFIIGIVGTWVVAHIYYRRACRDQNLLYEKLTCNARRWILDDQRTHLSVEDLNGLLDEKTIDPDSDYPFPYKVCLEFRGVARVKGHVFIIDSAEKPWCHLQIVLVFYGDVE